MKIWMRVAISLLLSLFTSDAWANPSSLLDTFCGEYVAAPGTALLQPARWARLAEKLSTSTPSEGEEAAGPALQDCRSRFSADFEIAEFILRAKSIIEATQNSAIERQTSQLGEALLDVSISELGDVRLSLEPTPERRSLLSANLGVRSQEYDKQWEIFLTILRNKIAHSVVVSQLVEKVQ